MNSATTPIAVVDTPAGAGGRGAAREMLRRLTELLLVKDEERRQVGFFLVVFFLLGAGIAVGRGSADALFFKRYGIEHLPAMYAVLSIVLGAASLFYAAYADRLPSERLFRGMFGALVVALSGTWALMAFTDLTVSYPVYFLVYEVASELLLLHASLYLTQNFETLQAKRLTPLVFAGAQVGTVAGGLLLAGLASVVGVQNLLLLWAALAGAALVVIYRRHRHSGASPYYRPGRQQHGLHGAVDQVLKGALFARRSPLLLAASIGLFFMVVAFYIMCYSVNRIYNDAFATEAELGTFFGVLTAATSFLALVTQLFITGRLLRRAGVQTANVVFPVAGLATYIALLGSFTLPAALLGSFAKDVLMPAIRRPVRQLFFNALPDTMQGRARALSVAFVLPLALAVAATVLIVTRDVSTWVFLAIGTAAALAYLAFNLRMNRLYRSAMVDALRERVFIPSDPRGRAYTHDPALLAELERGIAHDDESIAVAYAQLLAEHSPDRAGRAIAVRIERASPKTQDHLLRIGMRVAPDELVDCCRRLLDSADPKLRAMSLQVLFESRAEDARARVGECLESDNPRLRAVGILGVGAYGLEELRATADQLWHRLLTAPDRGSRLSGLELFSYRANTDLYTAVIAALECGDEAVVVAALHTLPRWPERPVAGLMPALARLMDGGTWQVRRACVECSAALPATDVDTLCTRGLEDEHPDVQRAAVDFLDEGGEESADLLTALILGNAGSPRAQSVLLDRLIRRYRALTPFIEIADAKIADALDLDAVAEHAAALCTHGGECAALKVLSMALEERCNETVELALKAMQYTPDAAPIETIRPALARGDRGDIAKACEVLHAMGNRGFARRFNELLERRRAHDDTSQRRAAQPMAIDEVLHWCAIRPDPWLRRCVEAAKSSNSEAVRHA